MAMSSLAYILGFSVRFFQPVYGAVRHNIEKGPPKDRPSQICFNLVQRFQRRRFKCDLLSKYAELKFELQLHGNE
jgi:hypothetical protein